MLEAHAKREAVKLASDVKNAMIGGLWANPNYDDGKQTRRRALEQINEHHQEIVRELYARIDSGERDITKEHPFFTAMQLDEVPPETPIHRPHDYIDTREIDQM